MCVYEKNCGINSSEAYYIYARAFLYICNFFSRACDANWDGERGIFDSREREDDDDDSAEGGERSGDG